MERIERDFREFLRNKGMKMTPERLAVLRCVHSTNGHFDADQLLEQVQLYNRKVSRATVYRILPLLVESGLITETPSYQGKGSYERLSDEMRHDHMVCIGCGEVVGFRDMNLDKDIKEIARKYGFVPVECRVSVRGYCKRCAGNGND